MRTLYPPLRVLRPPPGSPPPPPIPKKTKDAELEDAKKSLEALAVASAAAHEANKREREVRRLE